MNSFELHQRYMAARNDKAFQDFLRKVLGPDRCPDWKPHPGAKR